MVSVILSQEIAVAFVEFDLELAVDPKCHTTSIPENFLQQAKLQISTKCLKSQWTPPLRKCPLHCFLNRAEKHARFCLVQVIMRDLCN